MNRAFKRLYQMSMSSITPDTTDIVVIQTNETLISAQSNRSRQKKFMESISCETTKCPYFITCDVAVRMTFYVSERVRYETHFSPDVDNVMKRALDAISGPNGILINDTQVQHVTSTWIDDNVSSTDSTIELSIIEKNYILKRDVEFVQYYKRLCLPLPTKLMDKQQRAAFRKMLEHYADTRKKMESLGTGYRDLSFCRPIQRPFHSSKLSGFKITPLSEL